MIFHDTVNRTALIEQIQETRKTLEKLLTLLLSAPVERDRFVSHLYQSRREYRRTCETAGKSGKQIERCVISTFQVAESMGFKASFGSGSTFCGLAISHCGCLGVTICHTEGVRRSTHEIHADIRLEPRHGDAC